MLVCFLERTISEAKIVLRSTIKVKAGLWDDTERMDEVSAADSAWPTSSYLVAFERRIGDAYGGLSRPWRFGWTLEYALVLAARVSRALNLTLCLPIHILPPLDYAIGAVYVSCSLSRIVHPTTFLYASIHRSIWKYS